jgi:tripartite-type tricarboxylate transporter receptor subunit TctC
MNPVDDHSCPDGRRALLARLASLGALAALPVVGARAAAYPARPIKLIVPSAAGGSPDVICRVLADEFHGVVGQPLVIENKPGASGNTGLGEVARAEPDGYTLCQRRHAGDQPLAVRQAALRPRHAERHRHHRHGPERAGGAQ